LQSAFRRFSIKREKSHGKQVEFNPTCSWRKKAQLKTAIKSILVIKIPFQLKNKNKHIIVRRVVDTLKSSKTF